MIVSRETEIFRRPAAVWLIFVWFLYKAAGYAVGLSFLKTGGNALPAPQSVQGLTSSHSMNYVLGFIAPLLYLSGAVALVLLRRAAPWLFGVALLVGIGMSMSTISRWFHTGAQGVFLAANAALNLGIGAVVCWYSWRLDRAGRLG